MYIARILYPVRVLGPGDRIGIWFAGCPHHCTGCSNPELWEQRAQWRTDLRSVMKLIRMISDQKPVDGITITGGDPMFQPHALKELLQELKLITRDILVYTGYDFEAIRNKHRDVLDDIAVLIDGKYIEKENHGSLLRGSDNQNILILNKEFQSLYEKFLKESINRIQNFSTGNGIISVGIHRPDYEKRLDEIHKEKGLEVVNP